MYKNIFGDKVNPGHEQNKSQILEDLINEPTKNDPYQPHYWLVRVGSKFPKINGLPKNGEWTLQNASNGNLSNPTNPHRWKNLKEVEEYIEECARIKQEISSDWGLGNH